MKEYNKYKKRIYPIRHKKGFSEQRKPRIVNETEFTVIIDPIIYNRLIITQRSYNENRSDFIKKWHTNPNKYI
jgi:hypothetical protein